MSMNIMIINCHTSNRGDEAAVRSLIDEWRTLYPDSNITIALRGNASYPNLPSNVKVISQYIPVSVKGLVAHYALMISRCKIILSRSAKEFISEVRKADLILHAPGGPSIGDIYIESELSYLRAFDVIRILKKKYVFYAPSMGPFNDKARNRLRQRVLVQAEAVILRDPISKDFLADFLPELQVYQTLDSAIQHDIDMESYEPILLEYTELDSFLSSHTKCIGITIMSLDWHPGLGSDEKLKTIISNSFNNFLAKLVEEGYGIVFIPQLYGNGNDFDLMKKYVMNSKDYFLLPSNDEKIDSYFQQFIISKLYAVVGMRYHSNIFSAKMSTPFLSISYEQKMRGFMKKMKLSPYCIPLEELSEKLLLSKFQDLVNNHDEYKKYLEEIHESMRLESYESTAIVKEVLMKLGKNKR